MTYKEAVAFIKAGYPDVCYPDLRKAVDKAIEALEKQIPKKPLQVPYEESRLRTFKCPTCGSYELRAHCDNCGQRLYWGGE